MNICEIPFHIYLALALRQFKKEFQTILFHLPRAALRNRALNLVDGLVLEWHHQPQVRFEPHLLTPTHLITVPHSRAARRNGESL